RVRVGRVVLAEASWTLEPREIARAGAEGRLGRLRMIDDLRARKGLPRWVTVGAGDERLPVDLEHAWGVALFVEELRRHPGASVRELFPAPDELVVTDGSRAYTHELFVPFVRSASDPRSRERETNAADPPPDGVSCRPPTVGRCLPGGAWLSVHVGCT